MLVKRLTSRAVATLMDGRALAARVRAELAEDVRALGGVRLATVLVGDDPASDTYIRMKHRAADEVGIEADDIRLDARVSEAEVLELVSRLSADPATDGILPQLPMPPQVDEARVIGAVDPAKDVDGFHPVNAGLLYLGRPAFVPATPRGIMTLLAEYGVPLEGARAVVVGRSEIVGRPIALLLLNANATVTVCHSRTRDLADQTRGADVLVVAAGRAGLIGADMVREGACVVDVGNNRVDGRLVGDVADDVGERAALLAPVPGGVGPMTIASLLQNTVHAARSRRARILPC
jgi:methylenetetrahydrofolate dehydrogenase (NADP+) / methenyltetrahydrofolate cyclohydrolase